MAKPAAKAANQTDAKAQQPVGDGARIHDVGGHDKQRHSQQNKAVIQPIHEDLAGQSKPAAADAQINQRGEQNRIGHRRANPGQDEQGEQT